jgi:homeobox protein cut-like
VENSKIIQNYKENEQTLNDLVDTMKDQIKDLQKRYDQSQSESFKLKSSIDSLSSSHQTQIEILEEDLRKLQSKFILKESNSQPVEESNHEDFKLEIEQNKMLIKQFKEQIENLKKELKENENLIKEKELENSTLLEEYEVIQQQLNLRPNLIEFEKLKNRLQMIEEIEFKNISNASSKSIEQILSEKNHLKEKEVTDLKLQSFNLSNDLKNSLSQISTLTTQLESQNELIQKLENDLGYQTKDKSDEGMLDIVSEQRNRFRKKAEELEEENLQLNKSLLDIEKEKDRLKQDNIKMYEKVRYLQNYRNNPKV